MSVKIKTESLPTRCEICHQTDLFDASRNFCARCSGVPQVANAGAQNEAPRATKSKTVTDIELGATVGALVGLFVGIVGASYSLGGIFPGIIVGAFVGPGLWAIHGAIVGLFIGEGATITHGADVRAVSKAVNGSVSDASGKACRAWFKLFLGIIKGALVGLICGLVPAIISTYWLQENVIIWANYDRILVWALAGGFIGIVTAIFCKTRSDRRVKLLYFFSN
jgi:hypothetical protein